LINACLTASALFFESSRLEASLPWQNRWNRSPPHHYRWYCAWDAIGSAINSKANILSFMMLVLRDKNIREGLWQPVKAVSTVELAA
jgi:hypothetical protein